LSRGVEPNDFRDRCDVSPLPDLPRNGCPVVDKEVDTVPSLQRTDIVFGKILGPLIRIEDASLTRPNLSDEVSCISVEMSFERAVYVPGSR
jgi:hypothetical protein